MANPKKVLTAALGNQPPVPKKTDKQEAIEEKIEEEKQPGVAEKASKAIGELGKMGKKAVDMLDTRNIYKRLKGEDVASAEEEE